MEIIWYGDSCFHLRQRGCSVVTNPYDPETGFRLPRITAAILTLSRPYEKGLDYTKGFRGSPYVIQGPGEYEVGGTFVFGFPLDRDQDLKNTAYIIEAEDATICHLGDLNYIPTREEVEQFDEIDVLLVPVGGRDTIDGAKAAEVVSLLEPTVTIPMCYRTDEGNSNLEDAGRFLSEMGLQGADELSALDVNKNTLGRQPDVVLLERSE
ncbi:MAG: MBL fold metallo-hydrolase [Chloroflexota bacterium]|nr:MBL fold metallo-hydrolase [Chloroflexota bacterium]